MKLKQPGYRVLDVHNLPFADGPFASVSVIEALQHFPDDQRALEEIFRVIEGTSSYFPEHDGILMLMDDDRIDTPA